MFALPRIEPGTPRHPSSSYDCESEVCYAHRVVRWGRSRILPHCLFGFLNTSLSSARRNVTVTDLRWSSLVTNHATPWRFLMWLDCVCLDFARQTVLRFPLWKQRTDCRDSEENSQENSQVTQKTWQLSLLTVAVAVFKVYLMDIPSCENLYTVRNVGMI